MVNIMSTKSSFGTGQSRRTFLKKSAVATAGLTAGLMGSTNFAYAGADGVLRVGLVGCGGRGTGAARDAVEGAPEVEIVAMGELFEDRLTRSREALGEAVGASLKVTDDTCFVGFDAYKRVIESDVDMVILATPPAFRPQHLRACIEAGKHVFMEKPVSVDPVGTRHILETARMADEKGLSVVAGTLYRRQPSFMKAVERIHDGAIGELVAAQEYYMTGPVWLRERKPGMSDMEWQCLNWYYFTWLSGDHIVEQFVHNLDVINWVFQGHPESAYASGGRLKRIQPEYGHIYDHFAVEFTYSNGARVQAMCRQMANCQTRVENRIVGSSGVADVNPARSLIKAHDGREIFRMDERGNNAYVQEHTDLINAIREGTPINETEQIAHSTLTAILGRESAYTGQLVTWDEILNSSQSLVPGEISFDVPAPKAEVPIPGVTSIDRIAP
jgi:predicted dehydrogenase